MQYIRQCPKCNKNIIQINKISYERHKKLNKMCSSCVKKEYYINHPEALDKMSKDRIGTKMGKDNHNFGKKISPEQIEKFRQKMIGRKLTPEHIKNATEGLQKKYRSGKLTKYYFYKHWVDEYGQEEADKRFDEYKNKQKGRNAGDKNPMFGKPSPQGSGNGWKCWYGEYFCRSLRELMFILKLEEESLTWKTGECQKIQIKYKDYKGQERNYYPDFIVGNIMYEVKPKRLWETPLIKAKSEAAKFYCEDKGMTFKIIDIEIDFDKVNDLYNKGKVKFSQKYEEKFLNFREKLK